MEFLDVINEKDEVVGKEERNFVHDKHLLHRSVCMIIADDRNRILLQLRKATKKQYPLFWSCSAGGHVSSGESTDETAQRELKEEIGIMPELKFVGKFLIDNEVEHELASFFFARSNGPFQLEEEEMEKAEFFSIDEIVVKELRTTPHLKKALEMIKPLL